MPVHHALVERAGLKAGQPRGQLRPRLSRKPRRVGVGELAHKRQHRLRENRWLFGDRASLADMAVLPFVRQFAHTDPAWFAAQPWPELAAWLTRFEASALYHGVINKHPAWLAQTDTA